MRNLAHGLERERDQLRARIAELEPFVRQTLLYLEHAHQTDFPDIVEDMTGFPWKEYKVLAARAE